MRKNVFLAAVFCALACESMFGKQAPAPTAVPPSTDASEAALWNSIESSSDPRDFLAYLNQYPDGAHVAPAMVRVESYAIGADFGVLLMKQPVDYDTASVL